MQLDPVVQFVGPVSSGFDRCVFSISKKNGVEALNLSQYDNAGFQNSATAHHSHVAYHKLPSQHSLTALNL